MQLCRPQSVHKQVFFFFWIDFTIISLFLVKSIQATEEHNLRYFSLMPTSAGRLGPWHSVELFWACWRTVRIQGADMWEGLRLDLEPGWSQDRSSGWHAVTKHITNISQLHRHHSPRRHVLLFSRHRGQNRDWDLNFSVSPQSPGSEAPTNCTADWGSESSY